MDILSNRSASDVFQQLSSDAQKALKLAARRGAGSSKPISDAVAQEIGRDWVMVPTKRGLRQVAIVGAAGDYAAFRF